MSRLEHLDILMSGVGGQGIILASDILCDVAMLDGYDVKKSDSLGMSQRGGSVLSHVRVGKRVFSPLIQRGAADILISFEKLEGARNVHFLKQNGTAIVNDYAIAPLMVSAGRQKYPDDPTIRTLFASRTDHTFFVNAQGIAANMGNPRIANLVMLGFLSAFLPLKQETWKETIARRVPQRYVQLNLDAFLKGAKAAEGRQQYDS